MKCLILCGGRGIIDPETRKRVPKCLLKIGSRPLIWHVMKLFSNYGHTDFVLALGEGGDMVKEYFMNAFEFLHDIEVNLANTGVQSLNNIPEENWSVKLIDTGVSASTGARVARCRRYLQHESFFISYSDILADVNIDQLLTFHDDNHKVLTITGINPPSRFGTFYLENSQTIGYNANARLEMKTSRINGGFMVASGKLMDKLSPIAECNLETDIFNQLTLEKEIAVLEHNGFWQNVDTERDLNILQNLYEINKRPWLGIN